MTAIYRRLLAKPSTKMRLVLLWLCLLLLCATQSTIAEDFDGPPADSESSTLPRHPLERQALVDPEGALAALPQAIAEAQSSGDQRLLALLELARANACRVNADWRCQQAAGAAAAEAGALSEDPIVRARGLIADARASMALQDYTRGEGRLSEAEAVLAEHPQAELSADVDLGYSSLSHSLGKHDLAAEYARRGLSHLPPGQGLPMRVRLLRNLARALAQSGELEQARSTLEQASETAQRFVDPKLSAELFLEAARLARQVGDLPAQFSNAKQVLALSEQLQNSQLRGLGLEVQALAELSAGDAGLGLRHLREASQDFRELGLARDELRVGRTLLSALVDSGDTGPDATTLMRRLIELDQSVIQSERASAADDFDARLKYAEQQNELIRLESETALAEERARGLAKNNELTRALFGLSLMLLLVLLAFLIHQRYSNRRLRAALQAQLESQSQASDLLRLSAGFVCLHDTNGRLLMVNPAIAEAVGEPQQSIVGKYLLDFVRGVQRRGLSSYLQRLQHEGQVEGTVSVELPEQGLRHWRFTSRMSPAELPARYVIGHAVDVTDQVEQARLLREQNLRDALTGCFNRRYLEVFEQRNRDSSWATINIDLDHFKTINDTYGHDHGDQVLKEQAGFFQARLSRKDALLRTGGDEFLLLLARADQAVLNRMLARLEADRASAPCAFSIGFSLREDGEALNTTIARADAQMYEGRAKRRDGSGGARRTEG